MSQGGEGEHSWSVPYLGHHGLLVCTHTRYDNSHQYHRPSKHCHIAKGLPLLLAIESCILVKCPVCNGIFVSFVSNFAPAGAGMAA
jgi:hypothetical protein